MQSVKDLGGWGRAPAGTAFATGQDCLDGRMLFAQNMGLSLNLSQMPAHDSGCGTIREYGTGNAVKGRRTGVGRNSIQARLRR